MSEDLLRLEYIPLSQAVLFDRNPKKHDIGLLSQSISQYGFKDPPKVEPELNDGNGGIVEGNGRIITLRMMFNQGMERPRGIAEVEGTGEWAVPMLFGVDAASEAMAQAYAIDHNALTMAGGDFTAWDMSRLWDDDGYLEVLKGLAEEDLLPVSVDGEDFADLLAAVFDPMAEWEGMPEFEQGDTEFQSITVHFEDAAGVAEFADLVKQNITGKTKSIRFPYTKPADLKSLSYIDEP